MPFTPVMFWIINVALPCGAVEDITTVVFVLLKLTLVCLVRFMCFVTCGTVVVLKFLTVVVAEVVEVDVDVEVDVEVVEVDDVVTVDIPE